MEALFRRSVELMISDMWPYSHKKIRHRYEVPVCLDSTWHRPSRGSTAAPTHTAVSRVSAPAIPTITTQTMCDTLLTLETKVRPKSRHTVLLLHIVTHSTHSFEYQLVVTNDTELSRFYYIYTLMQL